MKAGAPFTLRNIVAEFDIPADSVTLTTKALVPMFWLDGVPDNEPSVPKVNQGGPETLVKVNRSAGFATVAWLEIEPEQGWPTLAEAATNGLFLKAAGRFEPPAR